MRDDSSAIMEINKTGIGVQGPSPLRPLDMISFRENG